MLFFWNTFFIRRSICFWKKLIMNYLSICVVLRIWIFIEKLNLFLKKKGAMDIYEHSKLVADNCVKIAKQYGLCREKCAIASYCHDISQIFEPSIILDYFIEKNFFVDNSERKMPFLLHQRCSAIFAYESLEIKDFNILTAIGCHTTLKSNPSKYDLALFVADKLSWDTEEIFELYDEVSRALESSLCHAAYAYINYMIRNGKIVERHIWLNDAIEWLEKNYIFR